MKQDNSNADWTQRDKLKKARNPVLFPTIRKNVMTEGEK